MSFTLVSAHFIQFFFSTELAIAVFTIKSNLRTSIKIHHKLESNSQQHCLSKWKHLSEQQTDIFIANILFRKENWIATEVKMPVNSRGFIRKNLLTIGTCVGVLSGCIVGLCIKNLTSGDWSKRQIMYIQYCGDLFLR